MLPQVFQASTSKPKTTNSCSAGWQNRLIWVVERYWHATISSRKARISRPGRPREQPSPAPRENLPKSSQNAFSRTGSLRYYRLRYSIDLRGVDLTGHELSGRDLSGANLSGVDLRSLDLAGASLVGANLDEANVSGVSLTRANTVGVGIRKLGGDRAALLVDSLPIMHPWSLPTDFSPDGDDGSGIQVSHSSLIVTLHDTVKTKELNALLAAHDAQVISSSPGCPGVCPNLVVIRFPSENHDTLAEIRATLDAALEVEGTALDAIEEPLILADNENQSSAITWDWHESSRATGGNWGLEYSRFPQMWNWNEYLLGQILSDLPSGNRTAGIIEFGFFRHDDVTFGELLSVPQTGPTFDPSVFKSSRGRTRHSRGRYHRRQSRRGRSRRHPPVCNPQRTSIPGANEFRCHVDSRRLFLQGFAATGCRQHKPRLPLPRSSIRTAETKHHRSGEAIRE